MKMRQAKTTQKTGGKFVTPLQGYPGTKGLARTSKMERFVKIINGSIFKYC